MVEKSSIYATVDLGSNSFHLLVARSIDGKLETINREKEQVKLANGLLPDGTLKPEVEERALAVLGRFANLLEGIPKDRIRVVGTNSLRIAKNSTSFYETAVKVLGVPIEVISGREEARLIYSGVARDIAPRGQSRLVVDIGGGSTELIVGSAQPEKMESLFMGCVSYTNKFFADGEISKKKFKAALNAARLEIQSNTSQFNSDHWDYAVGASGTIRTVDKIVGVARNSSGVIHGEDIDYLVEQLLKFDKIEDIKIPQLGEKRKYVFPGGLAILQALFKELKINEMHVTQYSLKEGILYEMLGGTQRRNKREETVQQKMLQFAVDAEQAKRVEKQALTLLEGVKKDLAIDLEFAGAVLHWAACLHELGLSISHSGYHKHGAYVVDNADLPGFNRVEQRWVSFLIQNHRRKLSSPVETYGFQPYWPLVFILRLSFLIHRRRMGKVNREITVAINDEKTYQVSVPAVWKKKKALLIQDLKSEIRYWVDMKVLVNLDFIDEKQDETVLDEANTTPAEESGDSLVLAKPKKNKKEKTKKDKGKAKSKKLSRVDAANDCGNGDTSELSKILDKKQIKRLMKKDVVSIEQFKALSKKKAAKILKVDEDKAAQLQDAIES